MKIYRCDLCKSRENENIDCFYRFTCEKPKYQKFRVIVPSPNGINVSADKDYFRRTEPELLGGSYSEDCEFILCPICMSEIVAKISGEESKVVFQVEADERIEADDDDD